MTKRKKKAEPKPEPTGTILVDQPLTMCPKCRSLQRDKYHNVKSIAGPVTVMGVVYSRIELRRTRCRDCRQCRIDRYKVPME